MKINHDTESLSLASVPLLKPHAFLSGFQTIAPRFRKSQEEALDWLGEAHAVLGQANRALVKALFARYSASADRVAYRSHELADFTHRDWEAMRLFKRGGSTITEKTVFFQEAVTSVFERLYEEGSEAPEAIVHVTCTGYSSPSGAQRIVSMRHWGSQTQVVHAYHMGCYASHPALRIAAGQMGFSSSPRSVDIVHTELCSLHLDPMRHDPGQLIIQSLFADGFIKYQMTGSPPPGAVSLEILAAQDDIIPDSMNAMEWSTGPSAFTMSLTREVPTLLASALPGFVRRLLERARLDIDAEKPNAVFAVHPGGPRIIELSQKILNLTPEQVSWSRHILHEHGNMSSATLPHIWQCILEDEAVPDGTLLVSLGAGPGLTLSGALFRKRKAL